MTRRRPPCRSCCGAGVLVGDDQTVTRCQRCGGTGWRQRCPAARLYRTLQRCGLHVCAEPYTYPDGTRTTLLVLWSAGKVVAARRVLRLVEKHFHGLVALLTGDAVPPECCGVYVGPVSPPVVNEGPAVAKGV